MYTSHNFVNESNLRIIKMAAKLPVSSYEEEHFLFIQFILFSTMKNTFKSCKNCLHTFVYVYMVHLYIVVVMFIFSDQF